MPSFRLALRSLVLLLAIAPALHARAADAPGLEVPIREVVLSDGVRRYAVTLTVDGVPIEAQLDTGSTGLRILAPALTGKAASAPGMPVRYAYGSGVELQGRKVSAQIGFPSGVVGEVPFQRVEAVACVQRKPDCPATRVPAAAYRIGGDGLPGQGFMAIIGTGLHDDAVPNPLTALGVQRWIVELPRGPRQTGRLILNPSPEDTARFRSVRFIDGTNQVPACLIRRDAPARFCGPAMIDTGASGLRIQGAQADALWPNGTPAVISLGEDRDAAAFPVTIGLREQASGMFAAPYRGGSRTITLNLGLAPFFHWRVLFDAQARTLGVAER
jgi:hypothetical protein